MTKLKKKEISPVKINALCVPIPKLQSIFQQIHMWRLGNIRAKLDHRKKERVQILALSAQALEENERGKKCPKAHLTRKGINFMGYKNLMGITHGSCTGNGEHRKFNDQSFGCKVNQIFIITI